MTTPVVWKKHRISEYEETHSFTGSVGSTGIKVTLTVDLIRHYMHNVTGKSDKLRAVGSVKLWPGGAMEEIEFLCQTVGSKVDFHSPEQREALLKSALAKMEGVWKALHDDGGAAVWAIAQNMVVLSDRLSAKIKEE